MVECASMWAPVDTGVSGGFSLKFGQSYLSGSGLHPCPAIENTSMTVGDNLRKGIDKPYMGSF